MDKVLGDFGGSSPLSITAVVIFVLAAIFVIVAGVLIYRNRNSVEEKIREFARG